MTLELMQELRDWTNHALQDAYREYLTEDYEFGAVNWGDLSVRDIELRTSLLFPTDKPDVVVMIEEADDCCALPGWLYKRLDKQKFPNVFFTCEW